ncbi:OmpH family outer membrane protein [Flavobacterium azooxidireducens]|uniref:OmpH family outer membrane protein n=1 Tax=Flavobacterium azooxidireducens TaxID=1871076 RepID=A0ABY4KHR8_9FLAO|nr:OmpH family outer membrane protein [Flavobacterium azooxidireducens]UPQ80084.1 OmpH family outer membrane protein [Flavobacterium azooxidireducens]
MKKLVFLLLLTLSGLAVEAQTRGVRIGYIDMEYILQNVPDYTEAKNQLELKAQRWKQEIETKQNEINAFKESLNNERVLLTKELIEEKEEEIKFLETELMDYQQKRFGPNGDLIVQKAVLIKPIQDQVFTAVQDLAEAQKFDFILDKSSDLTVLFAAKRHDISDRVIRSLTRASKREQMSKKQLKALEEKERIEDYKDDTNPALEERKKILEDRKNKRDSVVEARKALAEQKKKDFEDRRAKMKEERDGKKNGTVSDKDEKTSDSNSSTEEKTDGNVETKNTTTTAAEARQKAEEDRQQKLDERKKQIEERKQKILADREAAKKAREEKQNENKEKQNNN